MFRKLFGRKVGSSIEKSKDVKRQAVPPFHWIGANIDAFGASYFAGLSYHCSVGKNDWVPVGVAMCRGLRQWNESPFVEFYGESGTRLLKRFLVQRMRLSPRESGIDEWLSTNAKAFEQISTESLYRRTLGALPDDYAFASCLEHSSENIAELFLGAIERERPASLDRRMILCDSGSIPYWESDVIERAIDSARKALKLTTEIALSWFEFRGFRVDRELQLVYLEGYVPLTDYVESFF
ncbi:hypothetical protein [Rhizobium sp. BK176]|uniref:hypothetical protein n=1 Tax=Rhizobium sp. BK176 TaxID=2587071 RepID=UPI0021695E16|nr:hypothetical protein [Rhizobium sp. BK176]MCS4089203.1 hypothetical protein [Rhizobium sp. BK176]